MSKAQQAPLALSLRLQAGTQLIEASAGTGKTWTLTMLLARALIEQDLRTSQVLAITFTRAATAEIRHRVYALLGELEQRTASAAHEAQGVEDKLGVLALMWHIQAQGLTMAQIKQRARRALLEFDELAVFTIHGFYQRTLRENALATGDMLDAGVETDVQPDIEAITRDFWRKELAFHHQLSATAGAARARLIARSLLEHKREKEKQAVLNTPGNMAKWVGRLMQRAPQAQALSAEKAAAAFDAQLRRALQQLEAGSEALGLLQQAFSPIDISLAIAELQRLKRLDGRKYQRRHVSAWLTETAHWLSLEAPLSQDLPEKLASHFTSSALRIAMPGDELPLPGALQLFVRAVDEFMTHYQHWQQGLAQVHAQMLQWVYAVVREALPLRLAARNQRSADSLAAALVKALQSERGAALAAALNTRYSLVMVDEFQDTDAAQWQVLHDVFAKQHTPLILVGDPKQAIYRFRGADLRTYLQARDKADHLHQLTVNHRSTPALVAALNALFADEGAGGGFGSDGIEYHRISAARRRDDDDAARASESALTVLPFESASTVEALKAQAIAIAVQQVQALLAYHKPEQIALLVATHDELALVADALARAGIAAAAERRQGIAQSFEAQQLEWLIAALASPLDEGARHRVILSPLWGAGPAALEQMNEPQLQAQFMSWAALARERGPAAALECVIRERDTARRWLAAGTMQADSALARLRQVAEVVQHYTAEAGLAEALRFVQQWRREGGAPAACAAPGARQPAALNSSDALPVDSSIAAPRLASDRPAVKVMTVHASKGLEFEAVVLPLLWAGKEPQAIQELLLESEAGARSWLFGPSFDEAALQQHAYEDAGERQRVAYVALTRARDHCTVLWPAASQADQASAKKLNERSGNSALGAILNGREWPSIYADCDIYSPPASKIADINKGDTNDTVTPIRYRLAQQWPQVARPWQMLSFSRWLRAQAYRSGAAVPGESLEARAEVVADRDDTLLEPLPPLNAATFARAEMPPLRFVFARGPSAGRALHAVLERCAFGALQTRAEIARVAETLRQFGVGLERHEEPQLSQWLQELVTAEGVDGAKLKLCDVLDSQAQREWEFHLPISTASATALNEALMAAGAASVSELAPATSLLKGFLTGFIDLVFEHEGRYFVVDYKSNHLGDGLQRYDAVALQAEVSRHHYDVQAVFYLLALHRHLKAVLPGYDPAQHLGGASLLFLRGMQRDTGYGIWQLALKLDGLLKLDALFAA